MTKRKAPRSTMIICDKHTGVVYKNECPECRKESDEFRDACLELRGKSVGRDCLEPSVLRFQKAFEASYGWRMPARQDASGQRKDGEG